VFFFSSRRRHTRFSRDWSSDVCSSDLGPTLRISGTVPTREHPIPIGVPQEGEPPAGFTALTGVSSAAGDRVVMTAGGRVWMWDRSEERRVGKEGRSGWGPEHGEIRTGV